VNGPPTAPVEASPVVGVTERLPLPVIAKAMPLVAFPLPLVEFVKLTVSLYEPAEREFAPGLIDAVKVVVAPATRVPPVAESVTQFCVFAAVQLIELAPVLVSV